MSWAEEYGSLTVGEALALNEKAKQTCKWETTTQTEEKNETIQ